jgi:hypothetical protein
MIKSLCFSETSVISRATRVISQTTTSFKQNLKSYITTTTATPFLLLTTHFLSPTLTYQTSLRSSAVKYVRGPWSAFSCVSLGQSSLPVGYLSLCSTAQTSPSVWKRSGLNHSLTRQQCRPDAQLLFHESHHRMVQSYIAIFNNTVRFEVFTAVTVNNGVFWVVKPCGSSKNRRFGGTWRLLHQGDQKSVN